MDPRQITEFPPLNPAYRGPRFLLVDVADPQEPGKYKTRHMPIETVIHFELLAPTQPVAISTIPVPSFPKNFILREASLTFTRNLGNSIGAVIDASFGTNVGGYSNLVQWTNVQIEENKPLQGVIISDNLQPVAILGLKVNNVVLENYTEAPLGLTLWLTGHFVEPVTPEFSDIDLE